MGYSPRDHKELDMTEPLSVYACTHTHAHEEIYNKVSSQ